MENKNVLWKNPEAWLAILGGLISKSLDAAVSVPYLGRWMLWVMCSVPGISTARDLPTCTSCLVIEEGHVL